MENTFPHRTIEFMLRWLAVHFLAWIVGFMVAVLLSELFINPWHPKETNVLIGLGMGAAFGFGQWFLLKKTVHPGTGWIWVSALVVGIPFAVVVALDESGVAFPVLFGTEGVFEGALFFLAGALAGWWQSRMLRPHFANAYWWMAASCIGWGLVFAARSIWWPGIAMGVVTLVPMAWLLKPVSTENAAPAS